MDYEKCPYFRAEDTGNCNDIYDHPSYKYFCSLKKKKIEFPFLTCKKCKIRQEKK